MKSNIGKITKEQIIKTIKTNSREIEVANSIGWYATHKVHKSLKDYNRKPKHRNKLIYIES
jgi:hypothetical protein